MVSFDLPRGRLKARERLAETRRKEPMRCISFPAWSACPCGTGSFILDALDIHGIHWKHGEIHKKSMLKTAPGMQLPTLKPKAGEGLHFSLGQLLATPGTWCTCYLKFKMQNGNDIHHKSTSIASRRSNGAEPCSNPVWTPWKKRKQSTTTIRPVSWLRHVVFKIGETNGHLRLHYRLCFSCQQDCLSQQNGHHAIKHWSSL